VSQDTVKLAYAYGEALNAREAPDGLLAPDFVMVNAETAVTDKRYAGASGVIEWTQDIFEAFDATARFEIEQVVALSDELVVTLNRIAGVGARSRAKLLFRWAAVFWVREGKLAQVSGYLRRGEALKAVGLQE
jgi:ketosteroid isomerase-like protein